MLQYGHDGPYAWFARILGWLSDAIARKQMICPLPQHLTRRLDLSTVPASVESVTGAPSSHVRPTLGSECCFTLFQAKRHESLQMSSAGRHRIVILDRVPWTTRHNNKPDTRRSLILGAWGRELCGSSSCTRWISSDDRFREQGPVGPLRPADAGCSSSPSLRVSGCTKDREGKT